MTRAAGCPRCAEALVPPGLWRDSWTCPAHGPVAPLQPASRPSSALTAWVAARSALPLWLPWPLPHGWVVTGLTTAGAAPQDATATLVAVSGPNPVGGLAELLLVAEEPGTGLGARCAGLSGPDAGELATGRPAAKVAVDGRPVALWLVPAGEDRAAVVGERDGRWLWLVLRPASAGALLAELLALADLRDLGDEVAVLPYGALQPWLASLCAA